MNTLYMLIGIPCSGKSTYYNLIKKDKVYISSDDLIEKYAESTGKTYNDVFPDYVKIAEKLMYENALAAIKENKDIVWDQTNLNRKTRAKKLILFPDTYKKIAVVFKTPEPDILEMRLNSRPGKNIPSHVIQSMIQSMEYPSYDEGFDTIWSNVKEIDDE